MNNEDSNDRDVLIVSYLADDPDFAKDSDSASTDRRARR